MKTIDKMIIEKYHEGQKNKIRSKVGIKSESEYEYSKVKHRTRRFIPSLVSLCVSLIFLIVSTTLFMIDNLQPPEQVLSNAEKHLKVETIDYIKRPITTLIDNDTNLIIAIYYGVVGDALADHSHYLVFEIISNEDITIDTSIFSDEILIWSNHFILEDPTSNFYSFETNYDFIDIRFTVGLTVRELSMNLTNYYNFLRY